METQQIWQEYSSTLYFFILKRVKNETEANDILQNTFLKIHDKGYQLKQPHKAKAWAFQIARNEIANFYKKENKFTTALPEVHEPLPEKNDPFCCFDTFINELPSSYKETIELVYIKGKKQEESAEILGISLANLKARIRRSKNILKEKFIECCNYQFNKNGKLIGEPDCPKCS